MAAALAHDVQGDHTAAHPVVVRPGDGRLLRGGPGRPQGRVVADVDRSIGTWTAMQKALDSGGHRPTHLRGWKPE